MSSGPDERDQARGGYCGRLFESARPDFRGCAFEGVRLFADGRARLTFVMEVVFPTILSPAFFHLELSMSCDRLITNCLQPGIDFNVAITLSATDFASQKFK